MSKIYGRYQDIKKELPADVVGLCEVINNEFDGGLDWMSFSPKKYRIKLNFDCYTKNGANKFLKILYKIMRKKGMFEYWEFKSLDEYAQIEPRI